MATTDTTTISWGSRLGSSVKGVLVGGVLFLVAFPILFWNEGRAVTATKTNEEGASSVVEAEAETIDPSQDGKLVHLTGDAVTDDVLADSLFGVEEKAFSLVRKSEMFQWVESTETHDEKKLGGKIERTTTYKYSKEWCERAVDSDSFREKDKINPPARCELGEKVQYARNARIGVRTLNERQIRRISGDVPLKTFYQPVTTNEFFEISGTVPSPNIGDVRVTFSAVQSPKPLTIVAGQKGSTFMSYTAKSTGSTIDHVRAGYIDAAGVFAAAERGNKLFTWVLRFAGFMLMFFGISAVFKPLSVLADVVPFIGSIVSVGTGIIAAAIAFVASLVTIAVAWLFYRPLLAIVLIALAVGVIAFITIKIKGSKAPAKQ